MNKEGIEALFEAFQNLKVLIEHFLQTHRDQLYA